MERYLCIHCHFYQPPRENPWLESVELQDSAYPYHDWNERITAECYAPNAAARILDGQGRIAGIVNNYARISFNFGPTLLSWMEAQAPETYAAVLAADRESQALFSGHGSALAQAYNHMILPLASRRDRQTQVIWGIYDFRRRFGRDPEGMWLPETAVDTETLEVLAEQGIKFTILAPHQARQERRLSAPSRARPARDGEPGGRQWRNVEGAKIDPTRAYVCRLPSGRSINLFFYDGPVSRAVAFEGLLSSGEKFAERLLSGFAEHRRWPQLMHIATDGETYGHHHPHGDMALAYALHYIESKNLARITNYGEYLAKHPPTHEVEIIDKTSWSCLHGVERWRANCGCNTGRADWQQEWRGPLRDALDTLRDRLTPEFETRAGELLRDPWAARDDYIHVVLDRAQPNLDAFLARFARRDLQAQDTVTALKLLEMQRHLMLMYTSCGWFFDELSGIETVQVMEYAGRAVQLAQELFGDGAEAAFLEKLAQAHSNLPEQGNGAEIYVRYVQPAALRLLDVGAHFAISSLFSRYTDKSSIYCYDVEIHDRHAERSGHARLAVGRADISSRIIREVLPISFGVVHLGDHNFNAGVRHFIDTDTYEAMVAELLDVFARADMAETVRVLDRHFEGATFSLKSLFRDEQRHVLDEILENILGEVAASYRQIYDNHATLMRFLTTNQMPQPKVLRITAEFVLNTALRRAFGEEELDLDRISGLQEAAARERVQLDATGLAYVVEQRMKELAARFAANPLEPGALARLTEVVDLVRSLPFEVNLWKAQNVYYEIMRRVYPEVLARSDQEGQRWAREFVVLGERLGVTVIAHVTEAPLAA